MTLLRISIPMAAIILLFFCLRQVAKQHFPIRFWCAVWTLFTIRLLIPMPITFTVKTSAPVQPAQLAHTIQPSANKPVAISPSENMPTVQPPANIQSPPNADVPDTPDISYFFSSIRPENYIRYLWAIGGLLLSLLKLRQFIQFRQMIHHANPCLKKSAFLALEQVQHELNLQYPIALKQTDCIASPCIYGFRHPVILLTSTQFTEQELYYILKHELVHFQLHHLLFKTLIHCACILHWFNPLVWLMAWQFEQDMEICCDETLLKSASRDIRMNYCETLLHIVQFQKKHNIFLSIHTGGGNMKKRFSHILNPIQQKRKPIIPVCLCVIALISGMFAGCKVNQQPTQSSFSTDIANNAVSIVEPEKPLTLESVIAECAKALPLYNFEDCDFYDMEQLDAYQNSFLDSRKALAQIPAFTTLAERDGHELKKIYEKMLDQGGDWIHQFKNSRYQFKDSYSKILWHGFDLNSREFRVIYHYFESVSAITDGFGETALDAMMQRWRTPVYPGQLIMESLQGQTLHSDKLESLIAKSSKEQYQTLINTSNPGYAFQRSYAVVLLSRLYPGFCSYPDGHILNLAIGENGKEIPVAFHTGFEENDKGFIVTFTMRYEDTTEEWSYQITESAATPLHLSCDYFDYLSFPGLQHSST